MSVTNHLISLLIALPVAGAILIALTPRAAESLQKTLGLAISAAAFAISLLLLPGFRDVAAMQFVERAPWIPAWGITLPPRHRRPVAVAGDPDHVPHAAGAARLVDLDRHAACASSWSSCCCSRPA